MSGLPIKLAAVALVACALVLLLPGLAVATPYLISPTDGAQVPETSQLFTWGDTYAEGPLDHWYMEISSSPTTDYYPWGYFAGDLVFTATSLTSPSVNLNALGRALPAGTYYWHVLGYYGPWGSDGTAWTAVRSFTVQSSGAVAPTIDVNPTSLTFTVAQGDSTTYSQILDISNSGGSTMYVNMTAESTAPYPQWLSIIAGTQTDTVYSLPVRASAAGLSPGVYSARVEIKDNGSVPAITNSPLYVWVTLNVVASESSPPTGLSVRINNGAEMTCSQTVALQLAASDSGSGMGEMRFSNDGVTWSEWVPYATTKTWLLSAGTGVKIVRAQFRDKLHNESGIVLDSIMVGTEVAGDDRFATALRASRIAYPDGLSPAGKRTVVIATGRNWPDALGGTSLAGALDGPVLLVDTNSVPAGLMDEIDRLGATKAVILGGEAAVGPAVETALKSKLGATAGIVTRIAGANRYDTADKVAVRVITELGGSFDGTAFVATGANFPDALAAAPLAAAQGWPLYLANPTTGLSAATKAAMAGVTNVLILGGEAVVTPATETYLDNTYGAGSVDRLAGPNRYQTAVVVASYAVTDVGHVWDGVGVTTGLNFPDALAGGVLQGKMGSVMLLTTPTTLQANTASALAAHKAQITAVTFFGGTNAVTQIVRDAVANAIR
ncbi:MAG: cell wall-binding repeat-containing protein [Coriobacteriia bacterium]|nr:cell wall-binding repeat-containing protein [Coriobacteriia bacterium]